MRVRWSQLAYRRPGSDNEVALARVFHSRRGDVMRLHESEAQMGELEVGYLALVPLAPTLEADIDMWIEVDDSVFFQGEREQWSTTSTHPDRQLRFFQWARTLWWRWLRGWSTA